MKKKIIATTEKRKTHSYKCTDDVYNNACKAAEEKGSTLAVEIEKFVTKLSKNTSC